MKKNKLLNSLSVNIINNKKMLKEKIKEKKRIFLKKSVFGRRITRTKMPDPANANSLRPFKDKVEAETKFSLFKILPKAKTRSFSEKSEEKKESPAPASMDMADCLFDDPEFAVVPWKRAILDDDDDED